MSLTKLSSASQPAIAPKPPISAANGRSPDRTQYAVIDFAKNNNKRTAPRPSDELETAVSVFPQIPSTNGTTIHEDNDGIIRTVAVV